MELEPVRRAHKASRGAGQSWSGSVGVGSCEGQTSSPCAATFPCRTPRTLRTSHLALQVPYEGILFKVGDGMSFNT